jgi:hypothetical protein
VLLVIIVAIIIIVVIIGRTPSEACSCLRPQPMA